MRYAYSEVSHDALSRELFLVVGPASVEWGAERSRRTASPQMTRPQTAIGGPSTCSQRYSQFVDYS